MVLRVSFSAISDYQRCPRYYAYKYLQHRQRIGQSNRALAFGRAGHEAQSKLWGWDGDPADPARLTTALAAWDEAAEQEGLSFEDCILGQLLLIGYASRWDDLCLSFHTTPLVETKVVAPVLDPNGNPDPDLEIAAVFDVVAYDLDGATVPIEHKFTSSNIEPGSAYWGRLDQNLQASLYWMVATDEGRQVGHLLWDAVRAPELKRLGATPPELREFYKRPPKGSGAKPGDPKPGVRLSDETADEFAQRVMQKILTDPSAFYGRQKLARDEDELDRVRADVWQVGRQMVRSLEDNTWPRNLDACQKYNRPCQYLPVCRGETSIEDPAVYQVRRKPAEEKVFE